jgi:Tfp pilus assembly protein PilF
LKALSDAADAEDRTEKHPVTPGPLTPARELLGAMLLETGKNQEALVAYEAVLHKEPRRLNATLGVAKSAERVGDTAKARQYYALAAELAADASVSRPDVLAARAFAAKGG